MVRVSLTFKFVRTNKNSNEKSPTKDEIHNYLNGYNRNGEKRYHSFVKYLYALDMNLFDKSDEDEDVDGWIKDSCTVEGTTLHMNISAKIDVDALRRDLMLESLEDGDYESMPGEGLVFPVRSTVFSKDPVELGVLDYRTEANIHIA